MTFHHHDVVGAKLTRKRMQALRFSNHDIDAVSTLVELHLRFHGYGSGEWTDSAVRRYVRDAGDQLERLHILTRADCTTRNQRKADRLRRSYDSLEERIARLVRGGGAGLDPARPRRQPDHGDPRRRARPRGRRGLHGSCSSCGWTRARCRPSRPRRRCAGGGPRALVRPLDHWQTRRSVGRMPLAPVSRRSVPDEVFDQLLGEMVGGDLAAGESLPSERRLAEVLGVSRPAVREALQRLASAGFVDVRQGGSTTVRDFRRLGGLDLLPRLLLARGGLDLAVARSILEARAHVGPKIAELAAAPRRTRGGRPPAAGGRGARRRRRRRTPAARGARLLGAPGRGGRLDHLPADVQQHAGGLPARWSRRSHR